MKTHLEIAEELREESLRLYGEAARLQEVAMILEGTHYSVPDHLRPSQGQRVARMTPDVARRTLELLAHRGPDDSPPDDELVVLLQARAAA